MSDDLFTGAACPACHEQREHTTEEWKNHPLHRKGMNWTAAELETIAKRLAEPLHEKRAAARADDEGDQPHGRIEI